MVHRSNRTENKSIVLVQIVHNASNMAVSDYQRAAALESRICDNIMNTIASVSVETFGNSHCWDSILVKLDDEDEDCSSQDPMHPRPRTVLDELAEDLLCCDDDVLWAMTIIKLTQKNRKLTLPDGNRCGSSPHRLRQIAGKIIQHYALKKANEDEDEDEEVEEEDAIANTEAKIVLQYLDSTSDERALKYSGQALVSCAE